MALGVCVSCRIVGSGPRVREGYGEWARGREAGGSRWDFLRRERVMSEMEVRISESDTASP